MIEWWDDMVASAERAWARMRPIDDESKTRQDKSMTETEILAAAAKILKREGYTRMADTCDWLIEQNAPPPIDAAWLAERIRESGVTAGAFRDVEAFFKNATFPVPRLLKALDAIAAWLEAGAK